MHLLNTNTLALESINGQSPPYAILSHRWREGEVLFEDVQPGAHAETKAAYKKLRMACAQALADGLHYLWIDTCCIDKSSSAELSEAINSMFAWYSDARVCYAYLDDVPDDSDVSYDNEIDAIDSAFGQSEWFRRGWTLQELIAPQNLTFYSQGWVELGRKSTLAKPLAEITGIDEDVLTGEKPVLSCSVARRMSWAAKRETTRKEDEAYCLMGLFDVNMPMLYGEGAKAFIRLQEEIMKETDDETLFAWIDKDASPQSLHGLLAKRPAHFADSGDIVPFDTNDAREVFTKTNQGIQITLPAVKHWAVWEAALNCTSPSRGIFTIGLRELSERGGRRQVARMYVNCRLIPLKGGYLDSPPMVRFCIHQNLVQREGVPRPRLFWN
ncbi:putative het domain-containing protein [Lasiodiplodia theobromae]|uniref:Het domain-containing protein n=1 Tax=Lasiodiplodia theobromae TaxID=45133 RepID=A0A8H7INM7_9PEZI|nr:putative het domain-containing protein [Lasiodiplodia theobromae]